MFTPQEIQERSDSLEKAVFGGYSMSSVEELLEPLQKDYSALYKENAVLKSKMKVLVDRMEEYRGQEDSLNRAILAAQKTADEMIAEAERKCAKMTAEAEQRLRQRSEDLQKEIAAETEKVNQAKAELQQQIAQATEQAAQERAALQKKIAAEGERVVMAKKAAAAFVVELEDRIQQQLSQLESIKQMDLTVQEEAPAQEEKPAAQKPLSGRLRQRPTGAAASKTAEAAQMPKAAQTQTVAEPAEAEMEELPKPLSESEMSRQIEENLSRILAESMKLEEKTKEKAAGDARTASPV